MMAGSLTGKIRARALMEKAPSGAEYLGLSLAAIEALASELSLSRRRIEIAALEDGIIPLRYHRNIGSLGKEGQLALRRAKAAVIGAGGLGGTLIELLARLGIGALVVIDGETFTEDNLNRQLLCTEEWIGRSKVEAAAARISRVNSAVEVEPHQVFVTGATIDPLLAGCDVVIDALDSIPVRLILQEAADRLNMPFIHGAVGGFVGEVMTVLPGDGGLAALFGAGQEIPRGGIEIEAGVPTITPSVIAALEAMEAVKIILKRGDLMRNRMLYLDLDGSTVSSVNLSG
jgi:molybdopterin/thiamine biosynthesis adenylyltransferase